MTDLVLALLKIISAMLQLLVAVITIITGLLAVAIPVGIILLMLKLLGL